MDLGAAALLELNDAPGGKRLALCLPTGEFIFATPTAAQYFATTTSTSNNTSKTDAYELYGCNLCQFLVSNDIERLEDYMQSQCTSNVLSPSTVTTDSSLQLLVRIRNTNAAVYVRLQTVALSLRLARCIDAVQSLFTPALRFADASSFVVSDEDLAAAVAVATTSSPIATAVAQHSNNNNQIANDNDDDDDDPFFFASPSSFSYRSNASRSTGDDIGNNGSDPRKPSMLTVAAAACATVHTSVSRSTDITGRQNGKRSSSTASTDVADDDVLVSSGSVNDESLAGFAFEAEWASEVAQEPTRATTSIREDGWS